jgi:hypothetical protein
VLRIGRFEYENFSFKESEEFKEVNEYEAIHIPPKKL